MAFIVEDGTGLTDANSYASVQEYRDYASNRSIDVTSELDASIQGSLVRATDYVDLTYIYVGEQSNSPIQALEFPRTLDEVDLLLPTRVTKATIEMAFDLASGSNVFKDETKNITEIKEKVGPIETGTKYDVQSSLYRSNGARFPVADKLLKPYILSGTGNTGQIPVITG